MGCVYGDKGVDDVIVVIIDGTTYYYNKDHLGSIVGITDSNGILVSSYEYDSFGNFVLTGTDIGNDRLFTGREYDRETGLYYYRARYYDSKLGRFISRDPIDVSDNINLYTYVGNNPVNAVGPSGLKAKSMLKGAIEGDYNSDGDGWTTAGQILGGLIPVYGQASDMRDMSYAWDNGTYGDVAMAGIGFIPFFGDGAKALGKSGILNISEQLSEHALQRMKERGISIEDIENTLNKGEKFEYLNNGVKKMGYYLEENNVFVGFGDKITTVIKPTKNYINNLKNTLGK